MDIRSVSGSGYTANRAAVSYAATAGTNAAQAASAPLSDSSASDVSTDSGVEVRKGPGGYISPVTRYDQTARIAVLYFRNTDTGETTLQVPSERVVAEYRRTASRLVSETDRGATANGNGNAAATGTTGLSAGTSSTATATSTSGGLTGAQGFGTGGSATSSGGTFSSVAGGGAVPLATVASSGGAGASVSGGSATGASTGGLVSVTV